MLDFTKWAVSRRHRRPKSPPDGGGIDPAAPILGHREDGEPVCLPTPALERAGHLVCLASSGAGKTILIANALVHEIAASGQTVPPSCLVIDPKGDLIVAVLQGLAATAPARLADVRYLDPFSVAAFAFNLNRLTLGQTPPDIRAVQLASLVADVSTATGAQKHLGLGARQLDVLQHVILGALSCPQEAANILWALDALVLPHGLKLLGGLTTSERARQFLLTASLSDELRVSCASRIRAALGATDALERLVSSLDCVQFEDLLAPGRICLVDLGRPVGGLVSLTAFYANLIAQLATAYLMERPSPFVGGHCCFLVVDEAQIVAPVLADRAEAILTTGRSRALALTTISQGTTLIQAASGTLLRVLMTNSPVKVVGRLSAPDAELLAREQAPTRGIDETLASTRAQFIAAVTNLADREFFCLRPGARDRFVATPIDVTGWRAAAEAYADEVTAAKERLALPAETRPRVRLDAVATPPKRAGRNREPTQPPVPIAAAPARPRSRWG